MSTNRSEFNITNETRLALLEQSVSHINEALQRIDHRFDLIDKRFDKIEDKIIRLEQKVDSNFRWLITLMLTFFVLNGFMPIVSKFLSKFF